MPADIASAVTPTYDAAIPVPVDGELATSAALQAMVLPVANRVEYLRARIEQTPWLVHEIKEDFITSHLKDAGGDSFWDEHWNAAAGGITSDWLIADIEEVDSAGIVRFQNISGSAAEALFRKAFAMKFGVFRRMVARVKFDNISSGMGFEFGFMRSTNTTPNSASVPTAAVSGLFLPSASPNFRLRTDDGSASSYVDTGVPVSTGTWYQLDLAFDGSQYTLQVDGGTPVAAVSNIPAATTDATFEWKIATPASGSARRIYLDLIYGRLEIPGRVF